MDINRLRALKQEIECLHENEQKEIFKIIKNNGNKFTNNNNGIFINMNKLEGITIDKLEEFIKFCKDNNIKLEDHEKMIENLHKNS